MQMAADIAAGRLIDCGRGHRAKFVEYRTKQLTTVLSSLEVRRAYYYCESCRGGVIPKDRELDIIGTSFKSWHTPDDGPCRGQGSLLMTDDATWRYWLGVHIKTKAVERVSESIGEQIERISQEDHKAALSGKVVPFKSVPKMYIAMDGTGVPVVPCETEGRRGKDVTGKAKTREAKLGCVFTQTGLNEKGRPIRDAASTTYIGAIETAETFGSRIFAEGLRRGITRAEQVIVLGDGAHWIWEISEEHFHGAIQIVDLYHAREHLSELGKVLYGSGSASSKAWTVARSEELDA